MAFQSQHFVFSEAKVAEMMEAYKKVIEKNIAETLSKNTYAYASDASWPGSFLPGSSQPIGPVKALLRIIPTLDELVDGCPACSSILGNLELWKVIVHINDQHRWTREEIADWLDTLDMDLFIQPEGEDFDGDD